MKNNRLRYAVTDLSWAGIIGMAWYIPIFTVIYIGIFLIFGSAELDDLSYTSIGLNANSVFLLVMGIVIGSYYIKWGISLGITRKQFYKANLISGILMVLMLTAVVLLLGYLVSFLPFVGTEALEQWSDSHPVLDVINRIVVTFGAYMAGTLIGTGFYRNAWLGAAAIIITVLCTYLPGLLDPFFINVIGMDAVLGSIITALVLVVILAVLHFVFVRNIVISI